MTGDLQQADGHLDAKSIAVLTDGSAYMVGPEPGDETEIEIEDVDVEALTDEAEPEGPLVDAPGLGIDLPEADVLDQHHEVPSDEEDEPR